LVFVLTLSGCDRGTNATLPEASGNTPDAARAPDTPDGVVAALEDAYNAQAPQAMQELLGGRYVFDTATGGASIPAAFSRSQVLASLANLFKSEEVQSVELDLTAGPAEPANDPAFPGAMRIDATVVLEVVVDGPAGGEPIVYLVENDPAKFYVARGPSVANTAAGWQIVHQWDLADGPERPTADLSWSEILALFMPKPNDEASGE